jgi:Xaa-Pro aminopeptidase
MLKMVKSPAEIAKIRKAGEMVGKAYHSLTGKIRPGMSENDIAIELEYLLRKNGHLGENRFRAFNQIGLNTYVVSGESVNTPAVHDTPYGGVGVSKAIGVGAGNRKIEKGIPFMIDTVGNFEGYHNDNTRTFIFGEPSPEIREVYENLLEIYHFIVSKLNPDANCEDIYLRTLEKVESMGLSEHFMGLGNTRVPFIGHGIGIEVDEFPVFARKFQVALQPGMTVALEPKLFFEDFGGVGIESTFVITESGNECLSYLPEDMFII